MFSVIKERQGPGRERRCRAANSDDGIGRRVMSRRISGSSTNHASGWRRFIIGAVVERHWKKNCARTTRSTVLLGGAERDLRAPHAGPGYVLWSTRGSSGKGGQPFAAEAGGAGYMGSWSLFPLIEASLSMTRSPAPGSQSWILCSQHPQDGRGCPGRPRLRLE